MQPYLKHYQRKHGYIPLWVLVNSLTLGDANTLFKVLKEQTQNKIAKDFSINKNIESGELTDYMITLAGYRNLLAHDERFYKYQKLNNQNRHYQINFKGFLDLKKLHSSVFAVMIIFRILLDKNDFKIFIHQFITYLKELESNLDSIHVNEILKEMNIISFVTSEKTSVKIECIEDIITFFDL